MIFVHGRGKAARELAQALGGRYLRAKRRDTWVYGADLEDSVVINYGYEIPGWNGITINPHLVMDKERELLKLQLHGVPVPRFVSEGGIIRSRNHREGNDMLVRIPTDGFRVEKLNIEKEFRFHIFRFPSGTKSVRAGTKRPRPFAAYVHPWVRTWNGGWFIDYGKPPENKSARAIAKLAVEVLGYDFGAVDVGVKNDGSPVVLEVNSAPGLEGRTLSCYAAAFKGMIEEFM